MKWLLSKSTYWIDSILHSYSQLFFSQNRILALAIVLVTFFSPIHGCVALVSVILINALAYVVGFSREAIREGVYGFNAVLLGLALSNEFEITPVCALLVVVAVGMLLMITAGIQGVLAKYQLPFLAFPFLATFWVVSIAGYNLESIQLNDQTTYLINELAKEKSSLWYQIVHSFDNNSWGLLVNVFLKTLGGIFFQPNVVAGIIISLALLQFSRITFSLTVIGYLAAYGCYIVFGADINGLFYELQGANFIFLSIAIGCFFIIPNRYSYLAILVLSPILLLLALFFTKTLQVFHLKSFTLAFSVLSVAFLFMLHQRWLHRFLKLVTIQYYSAEKTIYKYLNSIKFNKNKDLASISLPFWGEWMVSQGYDGNITHLGSWSKALDFVILDSELKTYRDPGTHLDDFYCYDKPVLAPADGYVYDIINIIDDNDVADVNTDQNWGNTIVLNHMNGLFTQISHIKKDSCKVLIGDYVLKGTHLATCGNSGRSPEPHIHFQVQTTPSVGAPTYPYPISYFIEREAGGEKVFKVSEVPKEGTFVSNVEPFPALLSAFDVLPGKKMVWKDESGVAHSWVVLTDAYNRKYMYCASSKSYAYFVNDGVLFYFYDFEGDTQSLLFQFYLGAHRVLLSADSIDSVKDELPILYFNNPLWQVVQDVVAPFYLFSKVMYWSRNIGTGSFGDTSNTCVESVVQLRYFGINARKTSFRIQIDQESICSFEVITDKSKKTYLLCK